MDIYGPGVVQLLVVDELDVDINKISESLTVSGTAVNTDQLKVTTVNRAIKFANADILIKRSFEVSVSGCDTNRTLIMLTVLSGLAGLANIFSAN